jgi:hypothetical protein
VKRAQIMRKLSELFSGWSKIHDSRKKFYKAVIKRLCESQERTLYKMVIKIWAETKSVTPLRIQWVNIKW